MAYFKLKRMHFPANSQPYSYYTVYYYFVCVYTYKYIYLYIGVLADVLTRLFKTGSRKTSTVTVDNVPQQFLYVTPQQTHEHETRQKGTSVFVRMTKH